VNVRLVTVEVSFSDPELAILDELRARLRLASDADLIRVALWIYARGQNLAVPSPLFAVDGLPGRQRST
jgi:hypothetical protein